MIKRVIENHYIKVKGGKSVNKDQLALNNTFDPLDKLLGFTKRKPDQ